jgi:catechol-2,3-dioxygenase
MTKPRLIGINHVALEVGNVDEALEWYGKLFEFRLRGRPRGMGFIDLGDQFLALQGGREQPTDDGRHFGLVVDDKEAVRRALETEGIEIVPARGLNFRDPWGNRIEVVDYRDIQFTKESGIRDAMGITGLEKTEQALAELEQRGLRPG